MADDITTNAEAAAAPLSERLLNAAAAIRDDIRGHFRENPKYQKYLVDLLTEAAGAARPRT
jgi:hypothetical protein